MARKRSKSIQEEALEKSASFETMMSATQRANASNKTSGYFHGNLGDSIERRYTGGGGGLGNGDDGFQGTSGPNQAYQSAGYGNYAGTGFLNGFGRMFSGVHSGQGCGLGGFQYLKRFSTNSAFNHDIIASCYLAYYGYGVVKNIIDLYADFATEGLGIYHPNKATENFYKAWAQKIGLKERIHSMFLNLFISGQTFVHRRWATLTPNEKRQMKTSTASQIINGDLIVMGEKKDTVITGTAQIDDFDVLLSSQVIDLGNKSTASSIPAATEEELPENNKKRIPWAYTFLNPLQMEIRGSRIRNEHRWVMGIDKRDAGVIRDKFKFSKQKDLGTTEFNLPKEFKNRIAKYQGPAKGYFAEIKLSKEELSVVHAPGKVDWFDWAIPFVFPSLRALSFKDCLRNMELKACQSVINSMYLFKIGDIEKGMPADEDAFERLADMLQQPGQALNIIWNEAISAEVVQADVSALFDTKKHESADKDILTALGVPEVLVGGKGGNFSNSFIAVAGVLEKLESYREQVMTWLMGELKVIADAMGFQKLPEIRFGYTSLKDEKARQTFLLSLYDRNLLSPDTILREANTTGEIESSKLKEAKKQRGKEVFEPRGPFIKDDPVPPAGGVPKPGGAKPPAKKPSPNGRPPGSDTGPTGKQANPRGPKGQGLANILDLQEKLQSKGRELLDSVESLCGKRLLKARALENPNLKCLKQLKMEERDRLENLIYNVFSHMPAKEEVYGDDEIVHMLNSNAANNVKAEVLSIYTGKISEYSKTYGKNPTKEMRRQFIVSAWTQVAIAGHVSENPDLFFN